MWVLSPAWKSGEVDVPALLREVAASGVEHAVAWSGDRHRMAARRRIGAALAFTPAGRRRGRRGAFSGSVAIIVPKTLRPSTFIPARCCAACDSTLLLRGRRAPCRGTGTRRGEWQGSPVSGVLAARRAKGNPLNRLLMRLTGMEGKLNHYAAGERFIAAVEAVGGPRAVDVCWTSPAMLPSIDEIRAPQQWLRRMGRTRPARSRRARSTTWARPEWHRRVRACKPVRGRARLNPVVRSRRAGCRSRTDRRCPRLLRSCRPRRARSPCPSP